MFYSLSRCAHVTPQGGSLESSRTLPLIVLAGWLAACPGRTRTEPRALVVATVRDAITLDPAAFSDTESLHVAMQIFETLVRFDKRGGHPQPALAVKWAAAADQRSWTFKLRQGVRFHDGTLMDADAVVLSFERQRDRKHRFHFHDFVYWESSFRNIEKVEKVDRYTVRFHLDAPYAPFLHNVAMFPVSIVSPAALAKYGRGFAAHPVGTGPFIFTSWHKGRHITLRRNPHYWGRKPKVDRLVIKAIPDSRHRFMGLESDHVDVALALSTQDRQLVNLHPKLRLRQLDGNNVAYLAMNNARPPFDDVRVRQAINHAVNKRAVVKLVYQGLAIPARGPLPPGSLGYTTDTTTYAYRPRVARGMLKEAGWIGDARRQVRLYVMSNPRSYVPSPVLAARMIARNLKDAGMEVKLVVKPFSEFLKATQDGEHDLALAGWTGDNGDPDNFLYMLLDKDNARKGTARNLAWFTHQQFHDLLSMARQEQGRPGRRKLYRRAMEIVADEAPWVPLAHSRVVVGTRSSIHGFRPDPFTAIYHWAGVRKGGR